MQRPLIRPVHTDVHTLFGSISTPATIVTMPKPISDWEEDDALALPPGENDRFERKGTQLLDLTIPNVKVDAVLNELAKQLSAFANMGGGSDHLRSDGCGRS